MEQADERVEARIGGVPITVRGLNMMVFIALMAITSFTIWALSGEVTKRQEDLGAKITQEHNNISRAIELQTTALEKQTEALIEQNYILLADDKETSDLRKVYRRPESLRKKLGQ